MGFRYRKSVNVGGGFRVNVSKSGVGGSWGVKGMRFTKTATGRNRTTLSVPGTGISYVHESGRKRKRRAASSPEPAHTKILGIVVAAITTIFGMSLGLTAGIIAFVVLLPIFLIVCRYIDKRRAGAYSDDYDDEQDDYN
jgi:ABC-type xylose transport system permease subunit